MQKTISFLLLFLWLHITVTAQDTQTKDTLPAIKKDSLPPPAKKGLLSLFGQHRQDNKQGKLLVTPFFLPGYSPDILFSLAGGAVFSFKTKKGDTLLPISSVPVTLTYSTIKAFIASSGWTTFWLHDKLRINALIQFKVSRDAYYGVGYDNALTTHFPDSTNFRRSFFIFQVRPQWRLKKHLYAGVTIEYTQNVLWAVNQHMTKDPNYLITGQYIRNTGLGGIVSYDTRDFPQNASKGFYSALIFTSYQRSTGGNTNFRALDFDTRYFLPLSKNKIRTLAFNFRSRYDFGQTPFTSLISLGTSTDLRGLRFGQFRDQYLNYVISEYRHKFYRHGDKPSRTGFVLWTGLGSIGPNFGAAMFQRPIPDFGIGLRFEIQPRLNARIDYGYAPSKNGNHSATYFNFQEAY
jgi:hypothetical protein